MEMLVWMFTVPVLNLLAKVIDEPFYIAGSGLDNMFRVNPMTGAAMKVVVSVGLLH